MLKFMMKLFGFNDVMLIANNDIPAEILVIRIYRTGKNREEGRRHKKQIKWRKRKS